jgi:hypothetical protein
MSSLSPVLVLLLEQREFVLLRRQIMKILFQTSREPKTLVLERTQDGRLRLVVGLKKLAVGL